MPNKSCRVAKRTSKIKILTTPKSKIMIIMNMWLHDFLSDRHDVSVIKSMSINENTMNENIKMKIMKRNEQLWMKTVLWMKI